MTSKIILPIFHKVEDVHTQYFRDSTSKYMTKRNCNTCPWEGMYQNIPYKTICNRIKLEQIQNFIETEKFLIYNKTLLKKEAKQSDKNHYGDKFKIITKGE